MASAGAALWDYNGQSESELTFKARAIIEIVQPDEGGWTLGKLGDNEGWFPSSYLQVLDPAVAKELLDKQNQATSGAQATPQPAENTAAATTTTTTAATSTAPISQASSAAVSSAPIDPEIASFSEVPHSKSSSAIVTGSDGVTWSGNRAPARKSVLSFFGSRRASQACVTDTASFSIIEQKENTRELLEQKLDTRPTHQDLVSKNIIDAAAVPNDPIPAQRAPLNHSASTPVLLNNSTSKATANQKADAAKKGNRITRWFGFGSAKKEAVPASPLKSPAGGSASAPVLNTGTVFGYTLEALLVGAKGNRYDVPLIVKNTIAFLEKNGVQEGIFRLSGAASEVEDLKKRFKNADENVDVAKFCKDPNSAAVLLKQFFGQLPDPIFTFALFNDFVAFADKIKGHKQVENVPIVELQLLLKQLPEGHYKTVQYLMNYLRDLSKYNEKTKMASSNLALVFGPNLLRSKEVTAESLFGMNGSKLAEILILHYDAIFV